MSYHVSILRTENGEKTLIGRDEVIRAVEADEELEWRDAGERRIDILIAGTSPGRALYWSEGEVWMEDPGERDLDRMLRLAARLGARVRGDELETYRAPGDTYTHPEDEAELQRATWASRQMLHGTKVGQALLFLGIMAVFAFLVLLKRHLFD